MKTRMPLYATLFALVIASLGVAFAAVPGGASVTSSDKGEFPASAAGTIDVEAGHVYNASLDANMSTFRWAGVYGNTTGTIYLGDSSSQYMYSWTAEGNLVYMSTASAVTWSSLADADAATVTGALSFLASGSDSYANTFTGAAEDIGSNLFSITSDYAYTYDNTHAGAWKTYSLTDGTNLVWAGKVNAGGTAYNGEVADFQMIVPEDGSSSGAGATTYYVWVELV